MSEQRGMVLKTEGDSVHVLTRDGEFRRLPIDAFDLTPIRGEIVQLPASPPAARRWARLASAAVAAAVLLVALFSFLSPPEAPVVAYLEMEINPAVRLGVDAQEVVRTARARDDDGERLLEETDVRGQTIYAAASSLAAAGAQLGYLREGEDNIVLLTGLPTEGHPAPATDLDRLALTIEDELRGRGIGTLVSAAQGSTEITHRAEEHGLSPGREMVRARAEKLGLEIPPGLLRDLPLSDLPEQAQVPAGVLFGRDDPDLPTESPAPPLPGPSAPYRGEDETEHPIPEPKDETPDRRPDEDPPAPVPPKPEGDNDRDRPGSPFDVPRSPGGS